jgi:hypothetical protein
MYARLIAGGITKIGDTPPTECRDFGFSPMGLCVNGFSPWWIGAACIATGFSPEPPAP